MLHRATSLLALPWLLSRFLASRASMCSTCPVREGVPPLQPHMSPVTPLLDWTSSPEGHRALLSSASVSKSSTLPAMMTPFMTTKLPLSPLTLAQSTGSQTHFFLRIHVLCFDHGISLDQGHYIHHRLQRFRMDLKVNRTVTPMEPNTHPSPHAMNEKVMDKKRYQELLGSLVIW